MSRWLPLALALQASMASAQSDCLDIAPRAFAGTIAYRAGVLSRASFGSAFGVATFLESRIFPELDRGKSTASFHATGIANTARTPTIRPGCKVLGDSYETLPTMNYSVNIGFGAKLPYGFEVFYAGNVIETFISSDSYGENMVGHLTLLKGLGTGLIAPLMMLATDETIDGPQASYYDFVAGVGWSKGVAIRAGYVGSTGLFANIGSSEIGVSGAAILSLEDTVLAYLRAGVGPYTSPIGATSLFASASLLSSGPRIDPATAKEIPSEPRQDEWVTVHFKHQFGLSDGWGVGLASLETGIFADVEVAMTVRPEVEFFTAHAAYYGEFLYATVGVTQPPDLFALGGDQAFRFSLGAGMEIYPPPPADVETPDRDLLPLVALRVALNDPDMVRLFPHSPGQIVSMQLAFHLGGFEKR